MNGTRLVSLASGLVLWLSAALAFATSAVVPDGFTDQLVVGGLSAPCSMAFLPDGRLYASFGEDAAGCAAQDTSGLRGVVLRLDVSRLPPGPGGPPAPGLITPPGNPFPNGGLHARLIWAFGLRNPFRFHVDPLDGTLYIGDVGQSRWEELDRAAGGGQDFGWSRFEGHQQIGRASCRERGEIAELGARA